MTPDRSPSSPAPRPGIGLELARCCAEDGYDLLDLRRRAGDRGRGGRRRHCATEAARSRRCRPTSPPRRASRSSSAAIGERPVDALLANAGIGLGDAFLDQDLRARGE